MNVLTKAFVVVVTILAVVLVALVVPFVAQDREYAQTYDDVVAERDAQRQLADEAARKASADIAAKSDALTEAQQQVTELTSALAAANADKTALQADLDQAATTVARATAALEVSNRANEAKDSQITEQADVIQKMTASLGELNNQIAGLTQTLIGVRAENRQLSVNYLRIQEENKALVQQLDEKTAQLDQIIELARGRGIDLENTELAVVPDGGLEIRGSVTKINQVSDITLVQVNVGSRDQVKEGMEFTVYRGDQFVGKIEISTVDTAAAVGKLTLGAGVKEGDKIRAGSR